MFNVPQHSLSRWGWNILLVIFKFYSETKNKSYAWDRAFWNFKVKSLKRIGRKERNLQALVCGFGLESKRWKCVCVQGWGLKHLPSLSLETRRWTSYFSVLYYIIILDVFTSPLSPSSWFAKPTPLPMLFAISWNDIAWLLLLTPMVKTVWKKDQWFSTFCKKYQDDPIVITY